MISQTNSRRNKGIISHHDGLIGSCCLASGNSGRLYLFGLQIIADGDCSHESRRRLFLGRKVTTNLDSMASLVAQRLKHLPPMRDTRVQSLGREDPLEKEMATHSSILAWRIPWTEEPGRLQSTGPQRVGHD